MTDANPYSAMVVAIPLDDEFLNADDDEAENVWDLVLNIGAEDGLQVGSVFLIFSLGPDVIDPKTGESLGHFEVVRGRAKVIHLQERMCTVRSIRAKRVRVTPNPLLISLARIEEEYKEEIIPFDLVAVGDLARRV